MNIGDKCVVTFHYTLTNSDGEEMDSSAGKDPMKYLHGATGGREVHFDSSRRDLSHRDLSHRDLSHRDPSRRDPWWRVWK